METARQFRLESRALDSNSEIAKIMTGKRSMATALATHGANYWNAVSRDFHAVNVTPFADGVRFRLQGDVRRLLRQWAAQPRDTPRLFVDFGCGPGDALALVAGHVPMAVGIDFASAMLRNAAKRLHACGVDVNPVQSARSLRRIAQLRSSIRGATGAPQTMLVAADMRRLTALARSVDAATAINSICAPTAGAARRMFGQVVNSIRPGGVLFTVLPSLDSMRYLCALESADGTCTALPGESLSADGVHCDTSGYAVKLFEEGEIRRLHARAGMRIERLEKIRYPWAYLRSLGWGYHPTRPRLWDWYAVARATTTRR